MADPIAETMTPITDEKPTIKRYAITRFRPEMGGFHSGKLQYKVIEWSDEFGPPPPRTTLVSSETPLSDIWQEGDVPPPLSSEPVTPAPAVPAEAPKEEVPLSHV